MSSIVDFLKVYHFENKIRLGEKGDGGYVIGDIGETYDCYISAGVSNEESFSRDFISLYKMNSQNSFAFDGTINSYPYNYTRDITFYRSNIGPVKNNKNADLSFFTNNYNNIFLKMDIEGSEFSWLLSLSEDRLNKFKQIVIEFHGINDNSWDCNYDDKLKCLKKIADTHYIIHAHGNNYSSCINNIPDVIELTYIRKDYFDNEPKLNTLQLPTSLDYPNYTNKSDYSLNFYPFVNI